MLTEEDHTLLPNPPHLPPLCYSHGGNPRQNFRYAYGWLNRPYAVVQVVLQQGV